MAQQGTDGDELAGKTPAPVTGPGRPGGSTASSTRAKKAAPKKATAKKAAPKKAAAKAAPAKKAPPKKAAAKKAPAKKAPPKKAPAKKATAKKAPATAAPPSRMRPPAPPGSATRWVPGTDVPVPDASAVQTTPPEHPMAAAHLRVVGDRVERPVVPASRRAVVLSVSEQLLNDLALFVVGGGVALEPLDTRVTLPALGEVDVRLALTVTGGTLQLSADDGGRARVVVSANGEVSTRSLAYDTGPEDVPTGAVGLPQPPAPIPVRVEALVRPEVELHRDHTLSVGLDLTDATLVSLQIDPDAPTPDGVDAGAWAGILNVFGMMFGVLGEGLFDSLGEQVGTAGLELPSQVGDVLVQLGVEPGPAEVSVASEMVTIALAGDGELAGRALPVPIAGPRLGVGLADSVVDRLAHVLIARAAGDLPVPFELDVDLGEQQVAGRLRNARLLPDSFPDLRASLRTEVRTRLVRGRLELAVQAAWVELPSVLPSFVNQLSKRLGGLVALTPMKVRFPETLDVPMPDGETTLPIRIDDLRVTADGLGVVLSLA